MNWLLGLLEKLNRDDTVKELYHVVTHTLPGIGAKLNASIINAQLMTQEGQQLPAKLIQLAEKMSKSSELFATTRDRLNQEVSKLYLSVCTQIKQAIDSFFESDAITQFLDVAADNQTKRVKKLERELASKDLSNALQEATAHTQPLSRLCISTYCPFSLSSLCSTCCLCSLSSASSACSVACSLCNASSARSRSSVSSACNVAAALPIQTSLDQLTTLNLVPQVIKPENKGKLPGQSLQAVIFGPDRLEIDFQPLVDNINEKLQSFKEEIKETALRVLASPSAPTLQSSRL